MVTVITKTIGPNPPAPAPPTYDYGSFTAAEADVENIATLAFGSTDLVANDGAIVFEADAATYNEAVTFSSGLTTDATRNVTYKPAAGSEHGGDKTAGVIVTSSGYTLNIQDAHTHVRGLNALSSFVYTCLLRADGVVAADCIVQGTSTTSTSHAFYATSAGTVSAPIRIENCVCYSATANALYGWAGADTHIVATNVTGIVTGGVLDCFRFIEGSGFTANITLTNCLAIQLGSGGACTSSTATFAGSNNFGGSTNPFPVALQGSPYPVTATTDLDPGPGDWAIYDAATGALIDDPDNDVLAGGIGPDANPDVPTTDIVGNTRSGATTDPGAFEISTLTPPAPALITIMRQIYQQDASFSIGASSAGVEKITHQPGPASADYFTINSTTSATVSVPRTAHALRVICVVADKACDVTLELDASNSVYIGSIGGVASVQTDLTYFWSFGQVVSDGTYPRVKIEHDGVFSSNQLVYLWWHLA